MRRLLLLSLVALPGIALPQAARRVQHFRRGVNLSEWPAQDLALIRSMGFDHVRLRVNPEPLLSNGNLGYLDSAVQLILDHGLNVMIDVHPESEFKRRLVDSAFAAHFADFWFVFARHYAKYDPERVMFEVMNEPEMRDPAQWYAIETRLVATIRVAVPHHTIIVTGARWSDAADLLAMRPMPDTNLVYNFHYYEPHIFTHQSATWGDSLWRYLRAVPYPSNPANALPLLALVPNARDSLAIIQYGLDHWSAQHIDGQIDQVEQWARRWNVPVICNEFGVYRNAAVPADRTAWLADTRRSLEHHGMGWTMWDYSGGFGVVTKQQGVATPDTVTLRALGLAGVASD